MFQLNILSGKMAGTVCVARRFPFRVGRNADADLVSDEPGVWENHLDFQFLPGQGIQATAHGEALMTLNAERLASARLRNGDVIEIGGLKLRFWLSDVALVSHRLREIFTWIGLALLFVFQLAIIYWLVR